MRGTILTTNTPMKAPSTLFFPLLHLGAHHPHSSIGLVNVEPQGLSSGVLIYFYLVLIKWWDLLRLRPITWELQLGKIWFYNLVWELEICLSTVPSRCPVWLGMWIHSYYSKLEKFLHNFVMNRYVLLLY